MKRGEVVADEVECRVGYTGELSVLVGADATAVQPLTVTLFLEAKDRDRSEFAPDGVPDRKGIGKVTFGVFRPLGFPGSRIPGDLEPDLSAPLRRVWDDVANDTASWLRARFPNLRPEFMVFSSVQISTEVAGRRIALAVMADLINRHVSPGGIVLLNPYPLEFLVVADPKYHATPEQKQRGVSALKRHYGRIGLQAVDSEPDLMILQRPPKPIPGPRGEIRLTRTKFDALSDVYAYAAKY